MGISGFIKKEFLLVFSALLALISLFFVPFDTVLSYDYMRITKTICTLLFFLLIVAGLKECRALDYLAQKTVGNLKTTRALCLTLIMLPFFSAMLFSNDVSLLTFVPVAIAILAMANLKERIPVVIILQTVAANIGSSLTPFGNPHNLYMFNLHDLYGFSLMEYEVTLIPIVVVGLITFLVMSFMIKNNDIEVEMKEKVEISQKPKLIVLAVMFLFAIVTVLGVIPFYITLAIMVVVFIVMMPKIFVKIDYGILFVFFFLFVFANGITNLEVIHDFIKDLMEMEPMLTTVLVSQFTSNVPSTILLQPFTDDWAAVLVGADIGGFGTPIASMASVITLRLYLLEKDCNTKRYLLTFFLINVVMLLVLIPTYIFFR